MSQNINKNSNQQPQGKNPSTGGMGGASNMGGKTTPRAPGAGTDKQHQGQNSNLGNRNPNQSNQR